MRSRLEARWAAFFDLVGWKWEYEPFDLEGWIPDFKVSGPKGSLLVEVKPNSTDLPKSKIEKAVGTSGTEVLLLSDMHFTPSTQFPDQSVKIGIIFNLDWWDTALIGRDNHAGPIDVGAEIGDFAGRLTGAYDGNPLVAQQSEMENFWVRAGNTVQWRAP
jgi:hypothetical protein